jgi:hypothetical protein
MLKWPKHGWFRRFSGDLSQCGSFPENWIHWEFDSVTDWKYWTFFQLRKLRPLTNTPMTNTPITNG